jgi:hypothetical protein
VGVDVAVGVGEGLHVAVGVGEGVKVMEGVADGVAVRVSPDASRPPGTGAVQAETAISMSDSIAVLHRRAP